MLRALDRLALDPQSGGNACGNHERQGHLSEELHRVNLSAPRQADPVTFVRCW